MHLFQYHRSSRKFPAYVLGGLVAVGLAGCSKAPPPAPAAQAMPVAVQPVALNNVPRVDTYVATIKSRRSATMQPRDVSAAIFVAAVFDRSPAA